MTNELEETLYVQESDEGDYLLIKPIPGQVVAQVDPGPRMQEYARLFAAAPWLLACLSNLVERGLIKDPEGDHYDEAVEAIQRATPMKEVRG